MQEPETQYYVMFMAVKKGAAEQSRINAITDYN